MYQFEKPEMDEWLTPHNYYQPTAHFAERYRIRMNKNSSQYRTKKFQAASDEELGMRANYMLLFSIHGRPGETPNTEVRYYFDWEIVIDNKNRSIVTMYQDTNRNKLPASLFGDAKFRKLVYNNWFKSKKIEQEEG